MTVGRTSLLNEALAACIALTDERRALLARVKRPARPRLAEARALCDEAGRDAAARAGTLPQRHLATHLRAKERWEFFATHGLIPEHWVDDPRRVFPGEVCTVTPDGGLRFEPGVLLPHPATADDALAVASDAAAIASAEELAREAARRLGLERSTPTVAWRVAPSEHRGTRSVYEHDVVRANWILFRPPFPLETGLEEGINGPLLDALEVDAADYWKERARLEWYEQAWGHAVHEAMWDHAAREALVVNLPQRGVPGARRYAYGGDNPFTPLVALYALGYGCVDLEPQLTLAAPGL